MGGDTGDLVGGVNDFVGHREGMDSVGVSGGVNSNCNVFILRVAVNKPSGRGFGAMGAQPGGSCIEEGEERTGESGGVMGLGSGERASKVQAICFMVFWGGQRKDLTLKKHGN